MATLAQVEAFLQPYGLAVMRCRQPTPTVESAAEAVGCTPAEIAKTLLFVVGGNALAVVTCGDRKISSSLLKKAAGLSGKVKLPQVDEVEALCGYRPGGVCPFLLPPELPLFLDRSLQRFKQVYPAAGDAASAVAIAPEVLEQITAGSWVDISVVQGGAG